jgi:hypothetical protein
MVRTSLRIGSRLAVLLAVGTTACATEGAGRPAAASEDDARLAASFDVVKVYKSPSCGCCANWVEHMRAAGFDVEVEDTEQLASVKAEAGVPPQLQSCHTALIGDYVFEGHVPAAAIVRFLDEKPDLDGLAVPGMPVGSPGMEMGGRVDPFDVVAWNGVETSVYESHR